MLEIYGLKNCDTCRKAQKALKSFGKEFSFIDVRDKPLSPDRLQFFYAQLGDALLNKKSTTWRNLDDAQKKEPVIDLLEKHPTLMKRPLIQTKDRCSLGWSDDIANQFVG